MWTLLLTTLALASTRPAQLDEQIAAFEARTGVDLHLAGDRTEADAPIPAGFGPVDPALVVDALPVIESVLLRYPAEFRAEHLHELHLYGKLTMRGKPFLGAARPSEKRLDLAIRPRTEPDGLRSTIHHEISHIIEFDPRFPVNRWLALGSDYQGRLDQIPKSRDADPSDYWRDGFISRYASKNRHEDFAELAETAFLRPDKLHAVADDFPAIDAKLDLLTAIYQAAAPGMQLPWAPDAAPRAPEPAEPRERPARAEREVDDLGNPRRG